MSTNSDIAKIIEPSDLSLLGVEQTVTNFFRSHEPKRERKERTNRWKEKQTRNRSISYESLKFASGLVKVVRSPRIWENRGGDDLATRGEKRKSGPPRGWMNRPTGGVSPTLPVLAPFATLPTFRQEILFPRDLYTAKEPAERFFSFLVPISNFCQQEPSPFDVW